jgi:hypothetical protein
LPGSVKITLLATYTYSATDACFRYPGFPVEMMHAGSIIYENQIEIFQRVWKQRIAEIVSSEIS